jgi:hypothetical protein
MKKILSTLCALGSLTSLILGASQNPDGSCNALWTLGCIALCVILGYIAVKLNPEAAR